MTLVHIAIKDISNFVKEYQIHCFCSILAYGNNTKECHVLNFLEENMLCQQLFLLVKITYSNKTVRKMYSIRKMWFLKNSLCSKNIKNIISFSLQNNIAWLYYKAYLKFCWGISNILSLLESTLCQQYHSLMF